MSDAPATRAAQTSIRQQPLTLTELLQFIRGKNKTMRLVENENTTLVFYGWQCAIGEFTAFFLSWLYRNNVSYHGSYLLICWNLLCLLKEEKELSSCRKGYFHDRVSPEESKGIRTEVTQWASVAANVTKRRQLVPPDRSPQPHPCSGPAKKIKHEADQASRSSLKEPQRAKE